MKHVLTIFEVYGGISQMEEMPPAISMEYKIKDAQLMFDDMFPGDKIKVVWKNGHTQPVLDYMWQDQGWLVTARKAVLGITDVSSPKAFSMLKALAGGEYSKLIDHIRYDSPKKFKLPNGVWVTFATLKLGERREDGSQVWEPVALFNVDDYREVLDTLRGGKSTAQAPEPRRRKTATPSFEKTMKGGFWDRIKMIRKLPDGTVDYGDSQLSPSEQKKFKKMRDEGVLKFIDGRLVRVDKTFECYVPTFADYLSLGS